MEQIPRRSDRSYLDPLGVTYLVAPVFARQTLAGWRGSGEIAAVGVSDFLCVEPYTIPTGKEQVWQRGTTHPRFQRTHRRSEEGAGRADAQRPDRRRRRPERLSGGDYRGVFQHSRSDLHRAFDPLFDAVCFMAGAQADRKGAASSHLPGGQRHGCRCSARMSTPTEF